jgi:dolichyl-phosphate beta-glucosyltransferase
MSTPDLSVVIPAYNEARRLPGTLQRMRAYFTPRGIDVEVLVVDNRSSDGTVAAAAAIDWPAVRTLEERVRSGKGAAVRTGMLAAQGQYVLFSDADLSTPIEEVEALLAAIHGGADVAIASRGLPASRVEVHQPWYRERMGKTFNALVQLLVLRGIKDTQCGFKCFRASAVGPLFEPLQTAGFGFDVEVLVRAHHLGLRIAEIPTRWINAPDSRVRPGVDSVRMFLELLAIRRRLGRGRPRVAASAAGGDDAQDDARSA